MLRGTAFALSSVMQWYASTPDETSVRSLYRQMIEGWNRGSGADFAAPFAENSRFIAFDGTCFQGRDEIAVTHQRLFDTHLKGTLLTGQVLDIRFLREDVAVLYAAGNTVMRGKIEPSPERESVQTLVAVKDHGQWQLTDLSQYTGEADRTRYHRHVHLAPDGLALESVPSEKMTMWRDLTARRSWVNA